MARCEPPRPRGSPVPGPGPHRLQPLRREPAPPRGARGRGAAGEAGTGWRAPENPVFAAACRERLPEQAAESVRVLGERCSKMERSGEPEGWGRKDFIECDRRPEGSLSPPTFDPLRTSILISYQAFKKVPYSLQRQFCFFCPQGHAPIPPNKEEILQSRGIVAILRVSVLREDIYSKSLSTCTSFPRFLKPLRLFCRNLPRDPITAKKRFSNDWRETG